MAILLPAALVQDLACGYAARLYGEPSSTCRQMNLTSLRVVWPLLLSSEANQSLGLTEPSSNGSHAVTVYQACAARSDVHGTQQRWLVKYSTRWRSSYVFVAPFLISHSALWIHQPALLAPPASNEWAEVTHCYFRSHLEHIDRYTPMFLFHAPGSGVWLHTGHVYVADPQVIGAHRHALLHKTLVHGFGIGSSPGGPVFYLRFALWMANYSLLSESEAYKVRGMCASARRVAGRNGGYA